MKNGVTYLTAASVAQKILATAFFAFLSHMLGGDKTGSFMWAMAYTTLWGYVIDWGITPAITRYVSNKSADEVPSSKWIATSWTWRVCMSVVAYISAIVLVPVFVGDAGLWGERMIFVSMSGLIMVGDNMLLWANSVWRGMHKLAYEAKTVLWYQLGVVTIGSVVLWQTASVAGVLSVYALCSLTAAAYAHIALWQSGVWRPRFVLKIPHMRTVFMSSWGIILYGAFNRAYNYLDHLIVDRLAGQIELALYAVANKIILALQFLPNTFSAKYYALFSREYHAHRIGSLRMHFSRFMFITLALGFGIALLTYIGAPAIIEILFPKYTETIPLVQILSFAIIPICVNFPLGAMLNAMHKSEIAARNIAIVLVANILADIYFIPQFGVVAAAWSMMFSNWLFIILNGNSVMDAFILLREHMSYEAHPDGSGRWVRLISAMVISGAGGWGLQQMFSPLLATVATGALLVTLATVFKIWQPFIRMLQDDHERNTLAHK